MKVTRNYWQKVPPKELIAILNSLGTEADEAWRFKDPGNIAFSVLSHHLPETKFGMINHLLIKKVDMQALAKFGLSKFILSEEPTYKDKLFALNGCGKWKKVAVEVFPSERNLVDGANLYHIWEFENEKLLPFPIHDIFEPPITFEDRLNLDGVSASYATKVCKIGSSRISYLFLRSSDGKELTWYQKQDLKNDIYSDDTLAVEVILNKATNKDYTCLVCLPYDFKLGFGLNPND